MPPVVIREHALPPNSTVQTPHAFPGFLGFRSRLPDRTVTGEQSVRLTDGVPLRSGLEDSPKDAGGVGHDAVNAEVEKSMHLGRVIHRPDVDGETRAVRTRKEAGFDEIEAEGAHGDVKPVGPGEA
jgi:hypothetical protein